MQRVLVPKPRAESETCLVLVGSAGGFATLLLRLFGVWLYLVGDWQRGSGVEGEGRSEPGSAGILAGEMRDSSFKLVGSSRRSVAAPGTAGVLPRTPATPTGPFRSRHKPSRLAHPTPPACPILRLGRQGLARPPTPASPFRHLGRRSQGWRPRAAFQPSAFIWSDKMDSFIMFGPWNQESALRKALVPKDLSLSKGLCFGLPRRSRTKTGRIGGVAPPSPSPFSSFILPPASLREALRARSSFILSVPAGRFYLFDAWVLQWVKGFV